jgi:hypothetical protein
MRKLLVATGLAVIITSPALAQSYSAGYGTGNVVNLPALEHGGFAPRDNGESAFAAASGRESGRHVRAYRGQSAADADTVYESGQYVGRDPDPNVRLELRRDWAHD